MEERKVHEGERKALGGRKLQRPVPSTGVAISQSSCCEQPPSGNEKRTSIVDLAISRKKIRLNVRSLVHVQDLLKMTLGLVVSPNGVLVSLSVKGEG